MRKIFLTVISLLVSTQGLSGKGQRHHKAHKHGAGKVNIAEDGSKLVVDLKISLHDLVGFEHEPKNDKQRQAVEKLKQGFLDTLPKVVSSQTCKYETSTLIIDRDEVSPKSPKGSATRKKHEKIVEKDHHDHHSDHANSHVEKNHGGRKFKKPPKAIHGELDVRYEFLCAEENKLSMIELPVLAKYKSLSHLEGQFLGKSGARKIKLSKPNYRIQFK